MLQHVRRWKLDCEKDIWR